MMDYKLSGEKNSETLLFVHGLGANLSQFTEQHSFFSKDYRVVSVNVRGHGDTKMDHPGDSTEYTLAHMAEDISELMNFLEVPHAHFVGNSMGGNIGYELLKSNPDILKTLTTFGTTGELKTPGITKLMINLMYRIMSPKLLGRLSATSGVNQEAKQKIKSMVSAVDKDALLKILPNIANFSYLDTISNTKTPVMILKGGKDREINAILETTLKTFEARGNYTLHEVPHAGHFINLDNPRIFNSVLLEFISKHGE